MANQTNDLRGRQTNIFRLAKFYREGFIHSLFYHVLSPTAIIYGVVTILYLFYPANLRYIFEVLTVFVWVLFTPQFFETVKGAAMISSKGIAFNRFSESYRFLLSSEYGKKSGAFNALPYIALIPWVVGASIFVYYSLI